MKHDATFKLAVAVGDTADLIACVRLTPMATATRIATINLVRRLREAISGGAELPVDVLASAVEKRRMLAAAVGSLWTQVRSDVRRAVRAWVNEPRRHLACRLWTSLSTLAEAQVAFVLQPSSDAAKRCTDAIHHLPAAEKTTEHGTCPAVSGKCDRWNEQLRVAVKTFGLGG